MSDTPPDPCTAALSHPDPAVREQAVRGLRSRGAAGLDALPALLALFGDPDGRVACQARIVVEELGARAVPALRRVRRSEPGRLRPAALTALAGIGGEPLLSARDVAAVERLVRIKLTADRPQPLSACWLYWVAVAGGDQPGIMRILGLTEPRPATFALGNAILDADVHGFGDDEPGSPVGRVFVTPELDGWTLVAGAWCDPCDAERGEELRERCIELSARYGRAQAYYFGAQNDGSAWLVAENGTVVRRYKEAGEPDDRLWTLGEPLEYERSRRAGLGLPVPWDDTVREDLDDAEDEWRWEAFDLARGVAAALSIDPLAIGPHTAVRGTPVIALTPVGVAEGVPRGAYAI
ncbi:HEAT repeat domain-containing protein [Kitasatospora sp. DSM 101779]|uniref:HEAT repeat domain-containing protein n=1 Tax=Kitasatospora sp. DSM 101779 TaxID=2853165 RepID=UPI0021D903B0|nr:HEAT repeat domain-containing protein [Kitasatospora sp. DSM 101779]MCU7826232.1 HEAT repeat domain-containing protein [Kitasatospora sp. DSM 101779]